MAGSDGAGKRWFGKASSMLMGRAWGRGWLPTRFGWQPITRVLCTATLYWVTNIQARVNRREIELLSCGIRFDSRWIVVSVFMRIYEEPSVSVGCCSRVRLRHKKLSLSHQTST